MNFNRYSHHRVAIIPRMNTNEKSPSLRTYCVLKQPWYPPLDSLGILRWDPRDWNPRLKVSFQVGLAEHIQDNLTRDEKEEKNNEKKKRKLERVQFLCLLVWFCFFFPCSLQMAQNECSQFRVTWARFLWSRDLRNCPLLRSPSDDSVSSFSFLFVFSFSYSMTENVTSDAATVINIKWATLTKDAFLGFFKRTCSEALPMPLKRVRPSEKRFGLLHESFQVWWEICKTQRVNCSLLRKGGD